LPPETQAALMQHYERTGEYAKAEDMLYSLLEVHIDDAEILRFGMGFYQRLLRCSNSELAEGNLPRQRSRRYARPDIHADHRRTDRNY
jgi:hypothetical protein